MNALQQRLYGLLPRAGKGIRHLSRLPLQKLKQLETKTSPTNYKETCRIIENNLDRYGISIKRDNSLYTQVSIVTDHHLSHSSKLPSLEHFAETDEISSKDLIEQFPDKTQLFIHETLQTHYQHHLEKHHTSRDFISLIILKRVVVSPTQNTTTHDLSIPIHRDNYDYNTLVNLVNKNLNTRYSFWTTPLTQCGPEKVIQFTPNTVSHEVDIDIQNKKKTARRLLLQIVSCNYIEYIKEQFIYI